MTGPQELSPETFNVDTSVGPSTLGQPNAPANLPTTPAGDSHPSQDLQESKPVDPGDLLGRPAGPSVSPAEPATAAVLARDGVSVSPKYTYDQALTVLADKDVNPLFIDDPDEAVQKLVEGGLSLQDARAVVKAGYELDTPPWEEEGDVDQANVAVSSAPSAPAEPVVSSDQKVINEPPTTRPQSAPEFSITGAVALESLEKAGVKLSYYVYLARGPEKLLKYLEDNGYFTHDQAINVIDAAMKTSCYIPYDWLVEDDDYIQAIDYLRRLNQIDIDSVREASTDFDLPVEFTKRQDIGEYATQLRGKIDQHNQVPLDQRNINWENEARIMKEDLASIEPILSHRQILELLGAKIDIKNSPQAVISKIRQAGHSSWRVDNPDQLKRADLALAQAMALQREADRKSRGSASPTPSVAPMSSPGAAITPAVQEAITAPKLPDYMELDPSGRVITLRGRRAIDQNSWVYDFTLLVGGDIKLSDGRVFHTDGLLAAREAGDKRTIEDINEMVKIAGTVAGQHREIRKFLEKNKWNPLIKKKPDERELDRMINDVANSHRSNAPEEERQELIDRYKAANPFFEEYMRLVLQSGFYGSNIAVNAWATTHGMQFDLKKPNDFVKAAGKLAQAYQIQLNIYQEERNILRKYGQKPYSYAVKTALSTEVWNAIQASGLSETATYKEFTLGYDIEGLFEGADISVKGSPVDAQAQAAARAVVPAETGVRADGASVALEDQQRQAETALNKAVEDLLAIEPIREEYGSVLDTNAIPRISKLRIVRQKEDGNMLSMEVPATVNNKLGREVTIQVPINVVVNNKGELRIQLFSKVTADGEGYTAEQILTEAASIHILRLQLKALASKFIKGEIAGLQLDPTKGFEFGSN